MQILRDKTDCYAKVTCPERLTSSGKPGDWKQALPFAQTLAKEFPDRVISGTDWPHPNMKAGQMPNDGALVSQWIWEVANKDSGNLRRLLVENPRQLFGFPAVFE
jgi:2-pyrone-4,6-dicarboxylate lactonase